MINKILPVLILVTSRCLAVKWWIDGPDFYSPENWENSLVPCGLDKIVLPEEYSAAFTLPNDLTVDGIILPSDGALIIPDGSKVIFSNGQNDDRKCVNKNRLATVKKLEERSWFDFRNWATHPNGHLGKNFENQAVPHVERIPCENEEVVIEQNGPLAIDLDGIDMLRVGGITLNGRSTSAEYLNNMLRSELGKVVFPNGDLTQVRYVSEPTCGCHSLLTSHEYLWSVCQYSSDRACDAVTCLDPITVAGHCCPICGSLLSVSVDDCSSKNIESLRAVTNKALREKGFVDKLDVHVGAVEANDKNFVQIIAVGKNGYSDDSSDFMKYLNSSIQTTIFKLNHRSLHLSGMKIDPMATDTTWIIVLSTLLVVVLFFAAMYAHFVPENGYLNLPAWCYPGRYNVVRDRMVFARFDNTQPEGAASNVVMDVAYECNLSAENETEDEEVASASGTGFDNPMFREKSSRQVKEVVAIKDLGADSEEGLTEISLEPLNH